MATGIKPQVLLSLLRFMALISDGIRAEFQLELIEKDEDFPIQVHGTLTSVLGPLGRRVCGLQVKNLEAQSFLMLYLFSLVPCEPVTCVEGKVFVLIVTTLHKVTIF